MVGKNKVELKAHGREVSTAVNWFLRVVNCEIVFRRGEVGNSIILLLRRSGCACVWANNIFDEVGHHVHLSPLECAGDSVEDSMGSVAASWSCVLLCLLCLGAEFVNEVASYFVDPSAALNDDGYDFVLVFVELDLAVLLTCYAGENMCAQVPDLVESCRAYNAEINEPGLRPEVHFYVSALLTL